MRNKRLSMARKSGLPPGTLLHVGHQYGKTVKINVLQYDSLQVLDKEISSIDELASFRSANTVTWIRIHGLHNIELIEKVCQSFSIHPLVQEDILNTVQRPKLEDYGDYLFVVLKAFWVDTETNGLASSDTTFATRNTVTNGLKPVSFTFLK